MDSSVVVLHGAGSWTPVDLGSIERSNFPSTYLFTMAIGAVDCDYMRVVNRSLESMYIHVRFRREG